MFGSKRRKQQQMSQPAEVQQAPRTAGGYVVTELPTFHGRHRKVVVYTSDASGRIIKSYKK